MVKNKKIYAPVIYFSHAIKFYDIHGLHGDIWCKPSSPIQNIAKNVCAATPTFVILIMFKKLYPNTTFKEYLKSQFMKKINPRVFLISLLLQVLLVVIVILAFFTTNKKPLSTITFISASAILPVLIMNLTS